MRKKFKDFHLEITADKHFSNKLKEKIGTKRDIIFSFLKEAAPDITGYIDIGELYHVVSFFKEDEYVFLVIEVKKEKLKLDDIYQTRKYAELFNAWLAILITLEEIPEEIKRLSRVVKPLLPKSDENQLVISYFDHKTNEFKDWFPKNPFK